MDLLWDGLVRAVLLLARGDATVLTIAARSLVLSGAATLLAAALGVPAGAALHLWRFRGRHVLALLISTGMGLPPVVVGLVLTILLWRSGPLGELALLYTPAAMVLAQLVIAAPVAAGMTQSALSLLDPELPAALRVDGASELRVLWEVLRAARGPVSAAVAAAFGRAISEVGASLMVGGNIAGLTRVLTTATVLEAGRGEFAQAIALSIILLALALLVNTALTWSQRATA